MAPNATSGEDGVLVCMNGARCNTHIEGWGCCSCRGGRALCPPERPIMCEEDRIGSAECYGDHCCQVACASRGCPAGGNKPPAMPIQMNCPPDPPLPPVQPPTPPLLELVSPWRSRFEILKPQGTYCRSTAYAQEDYLIYQQAGAYSGAAPYLPSVCANLCLLNPRCNSFEFPGGGQYCWLWLNGACTNTSSPGIRFGGAANGTDSYIEYVKIPPEPPVPPPPTTVGSPPPPAACFDMCSFTDSSDEQESSTSRYDNGGDEHGLHSGSHPHNGAFRFSNVSADVDSIPCRIFLELSCDMVAKVTDRLNCTDSCGGCCRQMIPSPPSTPPTPPQISDVLNSSLRAYVVIIVVSIVCFLAVVGAKVAQRLDQRSNDKVIRPLMKEVFAPPTGSNPSLSTPRR